MKRKIIRKGIVALYLDDEGLFEVYKGGEGVVADGYTLKEVAWYFCDAIDGKYVSRCQEDGIHGAMKCGRCFLGNLANY